MKITENGMPVSTNITLQRKGTSLMTDLENRMPYLNILKKGKNNMEEKLLKLFKMADKLNESQDKIYAEIKYIANDSKTLEISIRNKHTYDYIEKCEIC